MSTPFSERRKEATPNPTWLPLLLCIRLDQASDCIQTFDSILRSRCRGAAFDGVVAPGNEDAAVPAGLLLLLLLFVAPGA